MYLADKDKYSGDCISTQLAEAYGNTLNVNYAKTVLYQVKY